MPYGLNVDINFGNSNASFQTLIDNNNKLQATVDALGNKIQDFANKTTGSNAKGQKSITDYAGAYSTLAADIKKNRDELIKELAALEKLRKARTTDTTIIDQQIGKIKQLESSIRQQTTTLNQYNKALGITKTQAGQANGALGGLTKGFGSLASVLGISFGIYGAFTVISDAVKAVAEFDLAQKKLQSILAENNAGMKDMSASAISLGKNSIFGAKGVTELQIELAKMGFAKQDIIAMQGAIVNLATATQEELAPSAEVVANIIRSFQLTASDATMVVDTMGKAFNDSALDLANFREAIKYVAPIAKQANFTFAETTALLEQLSNAGIKGSLAGTGLTNIISRLGNENSKFVKTLGHTVNGFDEFLAALVELKNKGADLTDIFQLVDRRAAATFSILLEGVDTVEQFKDKLNSASGVIKEQALVQLDSLTYRAKLVKESWKAMIIEMDKGSGAISNISKALLTFSSRMLLWIEGIDVGAKRQIDSLEKLEKRMRAMGLFKTFFQTTVAKADAQASMDNGSNLESAALLENAMGMGSMAESLMNGEIAKKQSKIADDYIKLFVKQANLAIKKQSTVKDKDTSLFNVYNTTLSELTKNKDKYLKMGPVAADAAAAEQMAIDKLAKSYDEIKASYTSLKTGSAEADKKAQKALEDKINGEIALLETQKKIAIEKVKLEEIGSMQIIDIGKKELEFDKLINAEKLKLAIASGKSKLDADKQFEAQNLLDVFKYLNVLQNVWDEAVKRNDKAMEEMNKNRDDRFKDAAKLRAEDTKNLWDWIEEQNKLMREKAKWEDDNPIWAALGFSSKDDEFIKALGDGFSKAKDYVKGYADQWVEQTQRVVDAKNTMVSESEQALQTEIALAQAGFASNVTLRRKELADAKIARDEALKEAKKARKAQAMLDTATQAGSLITAAADIFKSMGKLGPIGVAIAVGTIAAMLGSFIAFRTKAMQAANTDKFESGGEVGGRRHSQGGTHIEAEDGEFVIKRTSYAKHKEMVKAINNDDNITMNRLYINGLKNGVLNTRVSLDDSEDLKAIRKSLEKNGKDISYVGNYRIEKTGNVTSRIKLN